MATAYRAVHLARLTAIFTAKVPSSHSPQGCLAWAWPAHPFDSLSALVTGPRLLPGPCPTPFGARRSEEEVCVRVCVHVVCVCVHVLCVLCQCMRICVGMHVCCVCVKDDSPTVDCLCPSSFSSTHPQLLVLQPWTQYDGRGPTRGALCHSDQWDSLAY